MIITNRLNWSFACLAAERSKNTHENDTMLGSATLGIEVTEPRLAARCGLGNIDPQHGGDKFEGAAIEAACRWPLPPRNSKLVTIRPDADALGAMAVLFLRAQGIELSSVASERIALVAHWDKLARGHWDDWRAAHPPLLRPARAIDLAGRPLELQAINAFVRMDDVPMDARVMGVAKWLTGSQPPHIGIAAALSYESRMLADWNEGAITAFLYPTAAIALLKSTGTTAGGIDLAYRLAPVIIAEGQFPAGRKLTVAQFEVGFIDLPKLLHRLQRREPGWGGSHTIIGSPQGVATQLTVDEVAELAKSTLRGVLTRN